MALDQLVIQIGIFELDNGLRGWLITVYESVSTRGNWLEENLLCMLELVQARVLSEQWVGKCEVRLGLQNVAGCAPCTCVGVMAARI